MVNQTGSLQQLYFSSFFIFLFSISASVELSETSSDRVKKISFDEENPDEFLLTLCHSVIFLQLNDSQNLDKHHPKIPTKYRSGTGSFNDSCYVSNTRTAMTVTSNGNYV